MKKTALFDVLAKSSARTAEFQGWELPSQFADPSEEHHAVRHAAGLFDVSFLGRIEVTGAGAEALLRSLYTRSLEKLTEGSLRFGLFCDTKGAVIDTVLLFRIPAGRNGRKYLITTSAVATESMAAWLRQHAGADVQIADRSTEIGQLALQGPRAEAVLEALVGPGFKKLKDKRMREMRIADTTVLVSRSGFTGERGYELFVPTDRLSVLWESVISVGKEYGLLPCGMTCRDVLRLEAGYVLNGYDIDGTRSPLECRLSPFVDLSLDFVGKEAIVARKNEGVTERLIGFELYGKGIPRPGGTIFSESREIGVSTSGNHSCSRRRDIGLGYVLARYAQAGQEIEVEVKDREFAARIVDLPFYRRK